MVFDTKAAIPSRQTRPIRPAPLAASLPAVRAGTRKTIMAGSRSS